MTDAKAQNAWRDTGWQASRKAQLRQALSRSVRQRLQSLEQLAQTSDFFRRLRREGELYYPTEAGAGQNHVQAHRHYLDRARLPDE